MIPLMNRATETQRKHPRVRDEKAVEIVETLGVKTAKYDKLVRHECVVARTIMFDEALRDLITRYPDATVVNLGCGLDNRFARVDNGRIRWYDLDLPDSIEVRRKVFSDTERRTMLPVSVLDDSWTEKVKAGNPGMVIAVAEGLLMYLSREENARVLELLQSFPKGFLLAELMHPKMMDEKKHDTVRHTKARFGWGTDSGKEMEARCPGMQLLSEHSFSEQLRKSTPVARLIGVVSAKINNRLAVFSW